MRVRVRQAGIRAGVICALFGVRGAFAQPVTQYPEQPATSKPASAETARNQISLEYQTQLPDDCPGEDQLRDAVSQLVGYEPFVDHAPRVVSIEISSHRTGLVGLLRWRDKRGELGGQRRFESAPDACADLARNLAFALAVHIQLLNVPQAEAEPKPAPPPVPQPPPPTPPPTAAERAWRFGVGVGPRLMFGWGPKVGVGASLGMLAQAPSWSYQAAIEGILPTERHLSDGSGFDLWAWSGSFSPCLRARPFDGCVAVRLGQIRVNGFGVDEARSPTGPFAQAGLKFAAVLPITPDLDARIHLEGALTLTDWTVQLNGKNAFSLPPVSLISGIDVVGFFL